MEGQRHKKNPGSSFKWVTEMSQFNEYFIKAYTEECNEGNFVTVDV